MSEFQEIIVDAPFKCNTCKCCFASIEKIKEHYRSDWHVLNAKRRSNNLLPLKRDEYKLIVRQSEGNAKIPSTSPSKVIRPSEDTASVIAQKTTTATVNTIIDDKTIENDGVADADAGCDEEDEWEDMSEEGSSSKVGKVQPPQKISPTVSIFDDKEFGTAEECVQYMSEKFGFFIPDIEFLTNLHGLLVYLGEKVKLGGYCLYCQKQCIPGRPCQNHMKSKSHCKIAYEEGVDLDELEDFYDFTSSYEDLDVELDENGEVVDNEARVGSTGELVLSDGRILGHRDFKIYYKQNHRPTDTRAPIIAQQREELLRIGGRVGGVNYTPAEIEEMGDGKVMELLVKCQRDIRKGMMIEQRAAQNADWRAKRHEVNSKLVKMRSSETTTEKIRDYHKTVM